MSKTMSVAVALNELPEGRLHACTVDGREIVVCRTKDGVYALDNICTHAYARLNEGRLRGTRLICPLHGASFDVRDGRAMGAPATRGLVTHPVRVVEDHVEISITAGEANKLTP
jgi:nitrite reductase/ring-hydroxylating ferredoxin subunit